MKTEHWIVGAAALGVGLFVLHNASAGEPAEKKNDKPKPDAKAAASPAPAVAATPTPSAPIGTHVEAQDRADGKWYGATVQFLDLGNPDAVRWDAGTPPAKRNPKTGSSPASAVRAAKGASPAAAKPSADDLKEIARKAADAAAAAQTEANVKAANAGAAAATENPAAALSAILGSILH